ncbi:HTH-type transcriptional activator RhaS [Dyadobacter sp. CECT 9275]|uniref:HTH-type transcriptional activator RhaS n=1 Tax=Dyadobacter helix TaxID=2822344 RepID=A0A916JG89_9BACT|nr:AraC family transcriptional regulator [Dyadobacter sp. CECT 9275]CAG5015920.1 HTH-type transcriptional activator RhaS [Dyadobacter sp. CECT 9275]
MQKIPVRNIKSSIKEPDVSGKYVVWDLSELLSGSDMKQELHRHSFYFILILEKGSGTHIVDFTSYPVTDGSIYIMRPGQVHELLLQSDCKGYLLQFTDDFFLDYDATAQQILKKISRQNQYLPDPAGSERILSFMKAVLLEHQEKRDKYQYAIQVNLQLFFVELLRQRYVPEAIPDEKASYQLERLEEFRELVAENVSDRKHVLWYAERMNLSAYQLNTITKKMLGKTSSEVIDDYILLEAKRYLLATTNQVNQISWHLGYEDVSYFIRFFKKHTGYSPEIFRNLFK